MDSIDKLLQFIYHTDSNEIWREINGTDGRYFISDKGNILSLFLSNAIILSIDKSSRYNRIKITINGIRRHYSIHRLVAQAFIGDIENKVVHHKDLNPKNNSVDNLQICSVAEHIAIHKSIKK